MARITPTSTFDKILLQGVRAGMMPARTEEARKWFRTRARQETKLTDAKLIREDQSRLRAKSSIGGLYFFGYDPKHKSTLPFYDRFPLVFPIARYRDGFLGLNMHYLPYKQRAMLMDALYSLASNDKFDESTKLKISYQILKNASRFKWFKPCIKRYLTSHVRSRFVEVYPSEWDVALFLPVAQFEKASQQQVWANSMDKVKK